MKTVYIPKAVAASRQLYASHPISQFETTVELLQAHAEILLDAHGQQNPSCVMQINNWHPELIGKDSETVFDFDFKIDDALLALSKELGYFTWEEARKINAKIDPLFEQAVDHALAGDLSQLYATLNEKPELVTQTTSFGHGATILLYMGSNGVEIWRQAVPLNICEVVKMLIKLGADPAATANVYGGKFDVLGLAQSSVHPKDAGVRQELLDLLNEICRTESSE